MSEVLMASHEPVEFGVRPEVIAQLKSIVDDEYVLTDEEDIRKYSRDTSPWLRRCAAIVRPGSAQEVAQIVRVAATHELPVWPFSGGKSWGYGATMGYRDGALILMLDRLNRIVEVNEELAFAV